MAILRNFNGATTIFIPGVYGPVNESFIKQTQLKRVLYKLGVKRYFNED